MKARSFWRPILVAACVIYCFTGRPGLAAGVCDGFDFWTDTCALARDLAQTRARAANVGARLHMAIDPMRFRDVMARRFINQPDWQSFVEKHPDNSDPRCVYDPKPATWANWQSVADTLVDGAVTSHQALSTAMLERWNGLALGNTMPWYVAGGRLKEKTNFGSNLHSSIALDQNEVSVIENFRFDNFNLIGSQAQLSWTPLVCQEDLPDKIEIKDTPQECQDIYRQAKRYRRKSAFWRQTYADMSQPLDLKHKGNHYWFFYACWPRAEAPRSQVQNSRSCGIITYPKPDEVPEILNALIRSANDYLAQPMKMVDPIMFAARLQRQIVALHPFNKGNGRISRWVMDYITNSLGLPPITVPDMDLDISTPEIDYVKEAWAGALASLERMKTCLREYETARDPRTLMNGPCGLVGDARLAEPPRCE